MPIRILEVYVDEFHLLLREEQTAAYSVEIWKRFRKWGGIPTGITQNVKDLLSSREVENIFENSDFVLMMNQAGGDRQILAKQLNISPHQLSYVTTPARVRDCCFTATSSCLSWIASPRIQSCIGYSRQSRRKW